MPLASRLGDTARAPTQLGLSYTYLQATRRIPSVITKNNKNKNKNKQRLDLINKKPSYNYSLLSIRHRGPTRAAAQQLLLTAETSRETTPTVQKRTSILSDQQPSIRSVHHQPPPTTNLPNILTHPLSFPPSPLPSSPRHHHHHHRHHPNFPNRKKNDKDIPIPVTSPTQPATSLPHAPISTPGTVSIPFTD
ncbi:hypothetical protein BDW02DRAFT_302464 [Decorospora gaudefroyi]|uniref:Uncharacterized protein n=1 Tax=Decorospora gaudefroyi TaxID=184978 RepID=A0A6A5KL59_9PLEO|nr:hypothetical protein BDW02DRAFT_302464 [Decorospora gaudefroyi]